MTSLRANRFDWQIVCAVIARTREKIRLRAPRADLLDDPCAGIAIGDRLFVDATYDDGSETTLATVIGAPSPAVLEIETNGELTGKPKQVTIRRSRL